MTTSLSPLLPPVVPECPVVLVVEDEPGDAELIRLKLLERDANAFKVIMVDSVGGLRRRVIEDGVLPDAVLLDLNLPDSIGPTTVERCRSLVDAPIIVLTGLDDVTAKRITIAFGADDYLTKDCEGSELRRAVRYSLLRYQRDADARLAATVFARAQEGIYITDTDGMILDVNDAFTRITGYTRDDVVGQNPRLFNTGCQPPAFYQAYWDTLLKTGHWGGEIWNRRKNGEHFAASQNVTAVCNARGDVQYFVALFSDITSQKHHAQQLEHISHYDMLTGLPNRVLFADRLQQAMIMAKRACTRLAVVFIDLDSFQEINEIHGHQIGDRLLSAIAHNMRAVLRETDTLARIGGDEFAAVISDLDSDIITQLVLKRLTNVVARPCDIDDLSLSVSASIGVTFYPQEEEVAADQLLRQADQAMYKAKQTGKNCFHRFDPIWDRDTRNQHQSIAQVREGLLNNQFVLYYQPKIDLLTSQVVGVEALIRWQHPQQGLLPPSAFLPDIQNHPLEVELGDWVIDTALAQISQWRRRHRLVLPVSVNISGQQLQRSDFADRLREHFTHYVGLQPSYLELEILETTALEDIVRVTDTLRACNDFGVNFAFDDFGTSYSSLMYLKQLPATVIKIDQSFVRDMLNDPNDMAIVKAIIGLARVFERKVVAEGVENQRTAEVLLAHGCTLGQGYGVARPMPAAALPDWITRWQAHPQWLA